MASIKERGEGYFIFGESLAASAHACLNKEIFRELFGNFTCTASNISISECDGTSFSVGECESLPLGEYEYSINVCESGVSVNAECERGLIHGFLALLELIEPLELEAGRVRLGIPVGKTWDAPDLKYRMVHLCFFPEQTPKEIEKYVRVCAMLKCTHIVLELWGTVRLDSLPELAWRDRSYSKDELRPIISLARDLGVEIIPMFNHWGHASQSRGRFGKHTVLDQNPRLAHLFNRTGWAWRIEDARVRELHRNIRAELSELFGDGEFFHIGCDEAIVVDDEKPYAQVVEYINEVAEELRAAGRRTLMWGDMLLLKSRFDKSARYECNVVSESIEKIMLDGLSKDIIIADWQYNATEHPFKTSEHLKNRGFSVIVAPYDESFANGACAVKTANELSLSGVLHTTWHTLWRGMRPLNLVLRRAWDKDYDWNDENIMYVGALVGKVSPARDFESAGWSREQIGTGIV
ncbi:MAG: family 20 glycosylhydrolase [Clostridia bacterium]|nr:family 20 glycosylhydrolase [Clostridia bacterium]